MLYTKMAVGCLGRRSDERVGHGNESWHGYRGEPLQEEKYSHGLFNNAHQGKNKSDVQFIKQSEFRLADKMFKK